MLKPLTIITGLLFFASIFAVYATDNGADQLRKDISKLEREISSEKELLRIRQAEWSYRTNPMRLAELVSDDKAGITVKTQEFVSLHAFAIRPEMQTFLAGGSQPAIKEATKQEVAVQGNNWFEQYEAMEFVANR